MRWLTKSSLQNPAMVVLLTIIVTLAGIFSFKGEVKDKQKGFMAGTDDYLTKPFEPLELLYRIKALLRRYQMVSKQVIVINHTTLIGLVML